MPLPPVDDKMQREAIDKVDRIMERYSPSSFYVTTQQDRIKKIKNVL